MSPNLAASIRARLLNVAKAQGSDFQQVNPWSPLWNGCGSVWSQR